MAANKRNRKVKATYIREECCRSGRPPPELNEILDSVLDPRIAFGSNDESKDAIEWCKWLISGGRNPDEYCLTVRAYDDATTCGLVWTANFVAYRCRTCGISPCMSLCAECFQMGSHEGHDFNMFRSQAGGACDCGDTSVMKETGFCQRHGPKSHRKRPEAPPYLFVIAEVVLPRLILRLVQHLRERFKPSLRSEPLDPANVEAIDDAESLLLLLDQMSTLGAAMRQVLTQSLTNPQTYKNLTEEFLSRSGDEELQLHISESLSKYTEALKSVRTPDFREDGTNFPTLQNNLIHRTFLDELVFWTVKYEFPQKMISFLLNMLPDNNYKEAFTRAFLRHYSRICDILLKTSDFDTLSNRIVHVSVQLFSNEALAQQMSEELHLIHVLVISLKDMMKDILIPSTLHRAKRNFHQVVDCKENVMKDHRYWSIVSDLNNVMSHNSLVIKFLRDTSLLEMWFDFLTMYQGMNANQRELMQHVKFESNTYYAAFSAELESSAAPMWEMIAQLNDSSTLHLTKQVVSYCMSSLQDWFEALGFPDTDLMDSLQFTFHIPLHRYLSVFINHAVRKQGERLENILPPPEMLKNLIVHPLKAQVGFYEILCGMWVRNGLQMKGQAMTYIQCHFCNSMMDADLFLLQMCATHLDPDWFITSVFERFHVLNWFSLQHAHNIPFMDVEHEMSMLEGALTFLVMLFTVHTNIGHPDEDLTKREMVALLCMGDKTHSQLTDMIPEKSGVAPLSRDIEGTLARVADYRGPNSENSGNMQQGMYMPKPEVWEHDYDPIYVLLRAVHRRDFQSSMDRFTQFAKQNTKSSGSFWPPFRIPNPVHPMFDDPRKLLHCRTMHGILFTILYKSLHDPAVSEMALSLCVHLIDLAVRFPAAESLSGKELLHLSKPNEDELVDLQFKDWFSSSFLLTNLSQKISKVLLPHDNDDESERMEVDSYDMGVTEISSMVESPMYDMSHEGAADELAALASSTVHLPLPASETSQALVPVDSNMMVVQQVEPMAVAISNAQPPPVSPPDGAAQSMVLVHPSHYLGMNQPGAIPLPPPPPPATGHLSTTRRRGWSPMTRDVVRRALLHPHMYHQRQMHSNYVNVDESMLSLLLKLHSKLSGGSNSYVPVGERSPSSSSKSSVGESRVGDGPHFIGILLDKISHLSIRNARSISEICQALWPKPSPDAQSSSSGGSDTSDKEERRRRARERQQRLMAEFASQQKAFMEQSTEGDTDDDGLSSDMSESMDENIFSCVQEYDCVICGQTSPSREDKPIGMVCLLQATSVLGHACADEDQLEVPCSGDTAGYRILGERRAFFMNKRIQDLGENFDDISRLMSVNIGWEGGIHVRTCGHLLHLDCHKSYILSLKNQVNQRQQTLAVDKGEYLCPLCRQLSNAVLPIAPDTGAIAAVVKSKRDDQRVLATELLHLIDCDPPTPEKTSNLMEAMGCIVEDMVNITYPQYMVYTSTKRPESMFLFMTSVVRTNLELEVIHRGGSLCSVPSNPAPRPYLVPLLHVLGMHLKILAVKPHSQLWPQITGLQMEDSLSSLSCCEKEVPILLRDMSALLLQLILILPMHIDKAYFSCIVRMIYNIVYVQAVAKLSCKMSEQERLYWKEKGKQDSASLTTMVSVMGEVVDSLEHCALYLQDDDMDRSARLKKWTLFELQSEIREMCLPFLRVASLLQHYIHKEDLPIFTQKEQEYDYLSWFLGLHEDREDFTAAIDGTQQGYYSTALLTWITKDPRLVLRSWCQDFIAFVNGAQIASRNLLVENKIWYRPRLLKLPHRYDRIFQHYQQFVCKICNDVPKEPGVCLVCGICVCLRTLCCRKDDKNEGVQHSISCGAGTGVFLAINSSTIYVIRAKRACVWGSVYLDKFGEEDRDLKRGKPLFLQDDRYHLLEQHWLTHSFDHSNKRWSYHKDSL